MKIRYVIVLSVCLSLILLLVPLSYCQQAAQPFELTISADNDIYVAGDAITISVKMTNNSGRGVWLVKPQDGSEQAFRYPYCIFEVIDNKGEAVRDAGSACKTTTPLNKNGFIYLKPGETWELYGKGFRLDRFKLLAEGDYTVVFSYSSDVQKESQ